MRCIQNSSLGNITRVMVVSVGRGGKRQKLSVIRAGAVRLEHKGHCITFGRVPTEPYAKEACASKRLLLSVLLWAGCIFRLQQCKSEPCFPCRSRQRVCRPPASLVIILLIHMSFLLTPLALYATMEKAPEKSRLRREKNNSSVVP